MSDSTYPLSKACFSTLLTDDDMVVLDIGASQPELQPYPYKQAFPESHLFVHGFEPDAEECAALNKKAQEENLREAYYPFGLWDENGSADLFITSAWGAVSLLRPNMDVARRYMEIAEGYHVEKEVSVPIRRLDDWARDANVKRVDFMKMNIQGGELKALSGGLEILEGTLGIAMEYSLLEGYENRPFLHDLEVSLRSWGFQCYDLQAPYHFHQVDPPKCLLGIENLPHPCGGFRGQLVEGYAVYLRDSERFPFKGQDDPATIARLACVAEMCGQIYYAFYLLQKLTDHPDKDAAALARKALGKAKRGYRKKIERHIKSPSAEALHIQKLADQMEQVVKNYEESGDLYKQRIARLQDQNTQLLKENMRLQGINLED